MSAIVYTSTDGNFARDTASGVVLIDFWAPWCGPCQVMGPILEETAKAIGTKAKIMKHNVDTEQQVPAGFQIRSIPTMIIMKDGKPVERLVGVHDVNQLVKLIEKYI